MGNPANLKHPILVLTSAAIGLTAIAWGATNDERQAAPRASVGQRETRTEPPKVAGEQVAVLRDDTSEYPSYGGRGVISRTRDDVWTIQFDEHTEPVVFRATTTDGSFPADVALKGLIDLTPEQNAKMSVRLDTSYANNILDYAVELRLAEIDAHRIGQRFEAWVDEAERAAATNESRPGTTAAAEENRPSPHEPATDQVETMDQCAGGSCSCIGKCTVCCPQGYIARCSCSGAGRCECSSAN